ncbi:hypothetical protein SAMN03080617_04216 [Algoriphagus alkaliphilus]|uniref:Uncharacterized protein n=1 Tax=Algoriphagus alkaliphilus TaxID=279824 RepID=A0A1G5ZPE0_9BACT|nr:hypothetical protein SAMN03080617_04216 [Algoriphagus alkaliphilus]
MQDLLYPNLIWLLFALVYFVIPGWDFGYPHEDYIIYSRIAYYNDRFGVENTQTFYNIISNPGKIEVYHYAELWLSSLFKRINGLSFIPNLILISYPLMSYFLFLGINDLLKNQTKFHGFLVTCLILLVFNPYDEVLRFFDIGLPLVGFSSLIFNLKTLFILPPIILAFKGIIDDNPNYFLISIFSLFYPLIIPVLFIGLGLYEFFIGKRNKRNILIIIGFLGLFGFFSTFFRLSGTEINFNYFFDINVVSKMIWIAFIVPGLLLSVPIYYLDKNFRERTIDFLFFTFFVFITGAFFYILLFENIDSNQMFRNISSAVFSILLGIGIFYSFKYNKKFAFLLLFLYCFPITFNVFLPKSIKVSEEIVSLNKALVPYNKLIFIPNREFVNSVYQYNERLNLQILEFFLIREDIDLINISAAFPISEKINNSVTINMVSTYKSISPFVSYCHDWTFENADCLIDFAKSVKAEGILIKGDYIDFFPIETTSLPGNFKLIIFNKYDSC